MVCALAFIGSLVLAASFSPAERGIYFDNQLYVYASERMASGVPPHQSLVDHKQALATMLEGWAMAVGRVVGVDDILAGRALSILTAAGTSALTAAVAARLWGSVAAGLLAGAVMLVFADFSFQAVIGFRPKVFASFFGIATLWAWSLRRAWLAGGLGAAAYLCWQPALLVVAGVVGSAAVVARTRATVWKVLGGLLLGLGCYEFWFLWKGALGEQMFQSYGMAADLSGYRYPSLAKGIDFFLSMGMMRQRGQQWLAGSFLLVVGLAGLRALLGIWRREASDGVGLWRPDRAALLGAALASVAFTFVDHQAYPDLFILQPMFAVVLGGGAAYLVDRFLPFPALRACALSILVFASIGLGVRQHSQFAGIGRGLSFQRHAAKLVGVLEEEYGPVWAIGCVHLLALERKENFSRFGLFIDPKVRTYAASIQNNGHEGLDPLKNGLRPGVIMTSRGAEKLALAWLPRRYTELPVSVLNAMGIQVWILQREHTLPGSDVVRRSREKTREGARGGA